MKHLFAALVLFCCMSCAWLNTPQGRTAETVALDAMEIACVIGEAEMSSATIANDCGLLQKYGPGVIDVINSISAAHQIKASKEALERAVRKEPGYWDSLCRDAGQ